MAENPDAVANAAPSRTRTHDSFRDGVLLKLDITDPRADPSHPAFDFERWSQTIAHLRGQLGVPVPLRSGFVFRNLTVRGSGAAIGYQDTVGTTLTLLFNFARHSGATQSKTILQNVNGVLQKGELLLVLGRPGSGCTTFLKTITGQMGGLELDPKSVLEYRGIPYDTMTSRFRGELIYSEEADQHFPRLTVEQTLRFAGAMRTPRGRLPGITRSERLRHVVEVVLLAFGLSDVRNTIVGDDYVRGVSGGERKRVSIAEAALAEVAVSAWDNPTRGLDAATALQFVHRLRTLSDLTSSCTAAAIYQSSQAIFDRFDKVLVLDQGRQIFFGPAGQAASYFEEMGWRRHPRQTTADFLTAVADPARREAREGYEELVPATPEEFERRWRESSACTLLLGEMDLYQQEWVSRGGILARDLEAARKQVKQRFMLSRAPQTVSIFTQIQLCVVRTGQQLWNDRGSALTALGGQVIIAVVVGSIFYNTPRTTDALFSSCSVLFFSVLLNTLMAMTDIHSVYGRRAVVRKQVSWALYRPSADALASVVVDLPFKFCVATCFNPTLYFLAGLAPTADQFFIFFLLVFTTTAAMSMLFRTIAAASSTLAQAMAITGFCVLTFVTYTGFVLPVPSMPPWFKWISYLNPLAYAFEALVVNQAHGALYACAQLVPPYPNLVGDTFVCPVPGARTGETEVSGDDWFETAFGYSYSHLWRNLGIILGFAAFFLMTYLVASEVNAGSSAAPDVPVFPRRGRRRAGEAALRKGKRRVAAHDVEALVTSSNALAVPISAAAAQGSSAQLQAQVLHMPRQQHQHHDAPAFSWRNVRLEVKTKTGPRRLLDDVSGWVQPGTLTALMGVSGAGKTTLLNALAQRLPGEGAQGEFRMGSTPIIPSEFKRRVAYVQQQDVHLETSTVREALQFSALLRQGAEVPTDEKLAYAQDIIGRLGMDDFADAVVGRPGRGLSLEQRKRLSIGVELAARPSMLLFLDEPTSGLDGPSSDAIVALLRRLAANDGLAILCTIHQPSAMLFQQFDRLLLMARGGRVAYFGNIGPDSSTVLGYFYRHGRVRTCAATENAAEYLLDVLGTVGTAPNGTWPDLWRDSVQGRQAMDQMRDHDQSPTRGTKAPEPTVASHRRGQKADKYAMSRIAQLPVVCRRVAQQYWRSPEYIFSKFLLGISCSLLVGFSFFRVGMSIMDAQNAIFSVLLICATFSSLVQQIMPKLLQQRTLYEVRERHSNTYSWFTLLLANILIELPYNIVLGILSFAAYYYAVFGIGSSQDQGFMLLFVIYFYVLAGTFAQMVMAPLPDSMTAARVTTILFSMMILFAGVFQAPADLPRFWIFMYRVSPLTYLVGGASVSGLGTRPITCSETEVAVFQPGAGQSCGEYLEAYLASGAPGTLMNPAGTQDCAYCPLRSTSQVLAGFGMFYEDRLFDWAIGIAYVVFNITCMFLLYYLARVRTWGKWVRYLARSSKRRNPVSAA